MLLDIAQRRRAKGHRAGQTTCEGGVASRRNGRRGGWQGEAGGLTLPLMSNGGSETGAGRERNDRSVMMGRHEVGGSESAKDRTDRQLAELFSELRVVLPGAQVLLAFLFTVPFATRFGSVSRVEQASLFVALLTTVAATVLLMAPSVYHRMRWQHGGKGDVVLMGHRFFLAGTGCLAVGLGAGLFCVADFLYGTVAAYVSAAGLTLFVLIGWCGVPLLRIRHIDVRESE